MPKSKIKKEEVMVLEYLNTLNDKDLNKIETNGIVISSERFLYTPVVNRFMKFGFRYKFAWLYTLLFVIMFDLFVYFIISKFIPVFSIVFSIIQLYNEIVAYKQNKLW